MKAIAYTLLYWAISIVLVAVLLSSLSYSFAEALFIGTLFLPGALVIKTFLPKLTFIDRRRGIRNAIFLSLSVLIGEFLLILIGHMVLSAVHQQGGFIYDVPEIVLNPVFIALLIIVLEGGAMVLERWLAARFPAAQQTITFISDRQRISLLQGDIRFIESNDTEVHIYATEGRCYRNKTPISQWENLLGQDFIRIHRSYLVNRSLIQSISTDTIQLADDIADDYITLPVSRKYRNTLKNIAQS